MEEAVEFAKKHLGIQNFNLGDDLEMANWVNEGLVKISNRFKGKAQMPKNVIFDEKYFAKNPRAMAYHCAKNETIAINKASFDSVYDRLNKLINEGKVAAEKIKNNERFTNSDLAHSLLNKKVEWVDAKHFTFKPLPYLDADLQATIVAKVDKFKQNPKMFSRFEVQDILLQIQDLEASGGRLFGEPLDIIKNIAQKNPEFFKTHCKELSHYERLPKKQQITSCFKIMDKLADETGKLITVQGSYRGGSKFGVLWHEMGHLLHDMNTNLKEHLWGRLSGKAKKAFLADSEKLKTAGKISRYAQTNPEEFVAETFQALCAGKKLPDDVMKLYEYYKGPILPNM